MSQRSWQHDPERKQSESFLHTKVAREADLGVSAQGNCLLFMSVISKGTGLFLLTYFVNK